jgi:intergrase/recombinase
MGLASALLLTSVIVLTTSWLLNRISRTFRAHLTLKSQLPSPPGSFIAGHATSEVLGSSQAYLRLTEIAKKYGRTVVLRLIHKPVGPDMV